MRSFFVKAVTVLLFLINTSSVTAADLSDRFNNLPCTPSSNANLSIVKEVPNLKLEIGTTSRYAGSIHSLKVNGIETVDSHDTGRLLQYAFQLGGTNEVENPTEGGSQSGQPSVFLEGCSNGNVLYTKSQMAYWYPYNGAVISPFIVSKIVQIGVENIPNLIKFSVKVHAPVPTKGWQFETPTGYHTGSFTQVRIYDYAASTIRSVRPDEISHLLGPNTDTLWTPNLIIIGNGTYNLVPYIQQHNNIPQPPGAYLYTKWINYPLTKWSIMTYKEPDLNPKDYYFESYLLVSLNANVEGDLNKMFNLLPNTMLSRPPIGVIDSISNTGIISGWMADPDIGDSSTVVHFYLDRPAVAPYDSFIGSTTANIPRPDVYNAIGYGRNSGYTFQIPIEKINDGEPHTIYVYGLNKNLLGEYVGNNTLINPSGTQIPIYIHPSDLNSDGHVDIYDYNRLVQFYGNPYTINDYNNLVLNFGR